MGKVGDENEILDVNKIGNEESRMNKFTWKNCWEDSNLLHDITFNSQDVCAKLLRYQRK
jgi:hypothetical protein